MLCGKQSSSTLWGAQSRWCHATLTHSDLLSRTNVRSFTLYLADRQTFDLDLCFAESSISYGIGQKFPMFWKSVFAWNKQWIALFHQSTVGDSDNGRSVVGRKEAPVNYDFINSIGKTELWDSGSCCSEILTLWGIQAFCCLFQQNKDFYLLSLQMKFWSVQRFHRLWALLFPHPVEFIRSANFLTSITHTLKSKTRGCCDSSPGCFQWKQKHCFMWSQNPFTHLIYFCWYVDSKSSSIEVLVTAEFQLKLASI